MYPYAQNSMLENDTALQALSTAYTATNQTLAPLIHFIYFSSTLIFTHTLTLLLKVTKHSFLSFTKHKREPINKSINETVLKREDSQAQKK